MEVINISRIKTIYVGLDIIRPVTNLTIFYFGVKEPVCLVYKEYAEAEAVAKEIVRHGNKGEMFYILNKIPL